MTASVVRRCFLGSTCHPPGILETISMKIS
jgi:hypothetical protein